MKEMTFDNRIGALPAIAGQWHIVLESGHIFFVSSVDRATIVLIDGVLVPAVDAVKNPDAPLIQPKAYA